MSNYFNWLQFDDKMKNIVIMLYIFSEIIIFIFETFFLPMTTRINLTISISITSQHNYVKS